MQAGFKHAVPSPFTPLHTGTYHAAWLTCFNLPKGLGTAAPRCMTGSGKGRQVAWYAAGAAVIPCEAVRKLRSRQVASLREAEDPARGRYLSHSLRGGRPHGEAIFNEAEFHRNGQWKENKENAEHGF